ncbi:toxin-antitoxin system YwqK family antitoxin [Winogradskyella sp.]
MIKQKVYLTFIFTIILTLASAQKSVNQFDKNGKRHGLWTKNYYQTDQKRYEGQFVHGKEVDTFKYYTLSNGKSVLSATKVFRLKDSLSDVKFYTSKGYVISEGQMNGKLYIGQWVFYHKNSSTTMIKEHYNEEGQLEGERLVYYKNGTVAETAHYKNGKLEGESKWYSETKTLLRHSVYKNDELNGKTTYYNSEGKKTSEGTYVADRKSGIWKYYKEGKLSREIDHTNNKVIKKYD